MKGSLGNPLPRRLDGEHTSTDGEAQESPRQRRGKACALGRGFTLIELLIVVAIVALASGVATLALRDPQASALDREGDRLSALFEMARAESRAMGLRAQWMPTGADNASSPTAQADADAPAPGFRFLGLPAAAGLPAHWLTTGVQAEIIGARALVLGPEPMIGAQRVVLRLGDHRLTLVTDGLGPFAPERVDPAAPGDTRP